MWEKENYMYENDFLEKSIWKKIVPTHHAAASSLNACTFGNN
jgi:hypothetical protein